jgi:hypothetical protein
MKFEPHWEIVPDFEGLIRTLRLMEGLHYYAAFYSAGKTREEHIKLACSYAKAALYIESLRERGLILPF